MEKSSDVGGLRGPGIPGRRIPWRLIALYSLALVFLAVVVWRSRVWDSGSSLDKVDASAAAWVPLLSLAMVLPLALRQREILVALGHKLSALALGPVSYYGNTVGFLTPASSGELLRPSLLERAFGVPIAEGAAAVLFERLYSMYIMCLTGALAFSLTGIVPVAVGIAALPVFAVLSFAPLIALSVFRVRFTRLSGRMPAFIQTRLAGLDRASEAFDALWRSPRLAATFAVLSVAVFGLMLVQFWLLVEATGERISPAEAWVALFTANMVGVASGLPLGLGAADATLVSILNAYGIDLEAAGAIAILTRVLINLPAGILGLVAYIVTLRQQLPVVVGTPAVVTVPAGLGDPQ